MGTDFSATLIRKDSPEHTLWKHVLVHAIEESLLAQNDRKSSIFKSQAYVWLLQNSKDFKLVCYFGGFDPDNIRIKYQRAVNRGSVVFTEKQIAWVKYANQYNRYKGCQDHESRAYHRKHMEHLRNVVNRTPNVVVSMVAISKLV